MCPLVLDRLHDVPQHLPRRLVLRPMHTRGIIVGSQRSCRGLRDKPHQGCLCDVLLVFPWRGCCRLRWLTTCPSLVCGDGLLPRSLPLVYPLASQYETER